MMPVYHGANRIFGHQQLSNFVFLNANMLTDLFNEKFKAWRDGCTFSQFVGFKIIVITKASNLSIGLITVIAKVM